MALHNITFDDRDTDHIRYNNLWFITGSWNASSVGQTGTLSSANAVAANLTFTFPTPASAFYYYGIPRSKGGLYAICVDCDPNNPNFIQIDGVDPTDNGQNPPVVLFSVEFEVPGVHEIILTNQADPRFNGNSQITLDRFDLQVGDPDAVTNSPTTASIFATSAATPTTSSSKALSSSSTTSIVPIVAGVVGGVVLIAILALICVLRRRRQKRSDLLPTSELQYQYPPRVPPDLSPQPYFLSQDPMMTQTSLTGSQAPLRHGHAPSRSLSSFTTTTTSSSRGPRRELDAGRVLSEDEEDEQPTLPPDYQEVFSAAPSRTTSLGARTRSSSGSRTRSMASSSTSREPAYVFPPSRKS